MHYSVVSSVVRKVNEHMPTPLRLGCFCKECEKLEQPAPDHEYSLYSVIMHLGATMASGHYVAYVRPRDFSSDYESCNRYYKFLNLVSLYSTHGKNKSLFEFALLQCKLSSHYIDKNTHFIYRRQRIVACILTF